ncbi:MAG: hypothetical protein JKY08_11650 [Flavobacteriaceae bacterium]|nr:hypothetical protein [Flavobacteriaceae bacterium]
MFGSEGLAQLSTGDDHDEFDTLRVRHEVAQASKLLIETAVVLRNLGDSGSWPMDPIHEVRVQKRPEMCVGVVRDTKRGENKLSFREACNKLIHAEHISFGMKSMPEKMNCLDGTVELHGTRGKSSWVVDIQLCDFIRMAVRQL